MWSWIQGQFLDTITGGSSWYNGQSSSLSSALLIDYSSYIVQNVLLRQIRVVESKHSILFHSSYQYVYFLKVIVNIKTRGIEALVIPNTTKTMRKLGILVCTGKLQARHHQILLTGHLYTQTHRL